jgi:hypothetical protein
VEPLEHESLFFTIDGNAVEFQSAPDGSQIVLIREDNRILKCVAGTKESIHIVRLKTKGAEFEFRRPRYSATRLLIEIVHEACETAAALSAGRLP